MRTILIYRPIGNDEKTDFLAEYFVDQMGWAENDRDVTEIQVRFNCQGGLIFAGFAMISKMHESELMLNGMVDGLAASMAAFIALSCDKLTMNANAKLMLHLPQVEATGDAESLRATAEKLDGLKERFAAIIAKKAGITNEQAIALYLRPGTDVWLTAAEAKAANLCDEITGDVTEEIPATATAGELHKIYAKIIDTKKQKKMDRQKFIGLLGAQAKADMTEDEIFATVEGIITAAAKKDGTITSLKAQVKGFEDASAEARTAEITSLLDAAVEAKKITAEQRNAWKGMFSKAFENAKAMLETLTPAQRVADVPKPGEGDKANAELVVAWSRADKAGTLESLKTEKLDDFKAMYKAKYGNDYVE